MKKYALFFIFILLLGLFVQPVIIYAQQTQNSNETDSAFLEYKPPLAVEKPVNPGEFWGLLVKLSVFLLITVILIYLTVRVLKIALPKYQSIYSPQAGTLKILDSLYLGPNKTIQLISINNKRLLILGVQDKEINLLDKIENEQTVNDIIIAQEKKYNSAHSFKDHLKLEQKRRRIQELLGNYIRNLSESLRGVTKRA